MQRLIAVGIAFFTLSMGVLVGDVPRPACVVTGDTGPNRWSTPTDSSKDKPAKIGDPAGRMQVPVADGDVVAFVVNSGTHHVLFEHAASEQAGGTWKAVGGSGTLQKLADGKFPHYDHKDARMSLAGNGKLIQIQVLKLVPGKSILFGCFPHSESGDGTKVPMLGAILPKAGTRKN